MRAYQEFRTVLPRFTAAIAVLAVSSLTLSGCQTGSGSRGALFSGSDSAPEITGSIGSQAPSFANTRQSAKAWERNTGNVATALSYSAQLKAIGSNKQALSVLRQTYIKNPKDQRIAAAYGKQLAAMGRLNEASQILQRAQGLSKRPDWRVASSLGAVLDQLGFHKRARQQYRIALKLQPGRTSTLNNLGMSYALSGDLKNAESTLRSAVKRDSLNPKARQNLALVLGLQGRFKEAETAASKDLPPNLVAANMKFLRSMLAQRNTWDALKGGQKSKKKKKS